VTDHAPAAGTLWQLLDTRVAASGDAPMVATEDAQMTFAEIRAAAERAASGLRDLGVDGTSVVGWQLPTWPETVVLLLALARLGATQFPLLTMLRDSEVGFITRQVEATHLLVPPTWRGFDHADMAHRIATQCDHLHVVLVDRHLPAGTSDDLPPLPVHDDAVRWYYYTSGTTSDPKGARHSDRTIVAAATCMVDHLEICPDDRIACVFPFAHIAGAVYVASALLSGCSMALVDAFDPTRSPAVLASLDVTLVGAGTPFHQAYLAYQAAHPDSAPLFPRARAFLGGGAPKPPILHRQVKAELGGVGIVSGYGLTEAPIITMGHLDDDDDELATTEGAPGPGVELRFTDADGADVAPGADGEILLRAPQLMHGYVDGGLDAGAFFDGWFRTGDLGHLSAAGNIVITGRAKDVIIRNMENISAKEVEDILAEHPDIADCAVIGVPDDRTGERVCAVVVLAGDTTPTLAELAAYTVDRGLAIQKAPERLEIVTSLPRNDTGKVRKIDLRARFAADPAAGR
jgi:acyl-CoA synthetase (AMP-forming)/AMP-acid ligase II